MSGSTLSGTFSAAGVSPAIYISRDETLTFALAVAADESFIGTVKLQSSHNGGQTWEPVDTWTGTEGAPLEDDVASGTLRSPGAQYRFVCLAFDEASDDIDWALSDTEDTLRGARIVDGVVQNRRTGATVLRFTEAGIETPVLGADKVVLPAGGAIYLGADDVEGSWRIKRNSDDLVYQRLDDVEGTLTWVTKSTIAAVEE